MTYITWPAGTKNVIDSIRYAIGRDVTFVVASSTVCPACGVDPITGESINPFCTVCSGEGYLYTYSGITISGHITWGYSEFPAWHAGGKIDEGDCRVQVEYTIANLSAIDNSEWVEVDGRKLKVVKKILRGVQPLNRILVDLIEQERTT